MLAPYSNEYNGYITTTEEYQMQMYEAGHNVFGQWSLNALQQTFTELAGEFSKSKESRNLDRGVLPDKFTEADIKKGIFFESNRIRRLNKKK